MGSMNPEKVLEPAGPPVCAEFAHPMLTSRCGRILVFALQMLMQEILMQGVSSTDARWY